VDHTRARQARAQHEVEGLGADQSTSDESVTRYTQRHRKRNAKVNAIHTRLGLSNRRSQSRANQTNRKSPLEGLGLIQ
jgi:Asp-tRNA(Asn)/Glu-tRNA(Gln) amidotransferase A subunit family amidase